MYQKENTHKPIPVVEQSEEELDSFLLNFNETSDEGEPSPEKLLELSRKAPDPIVTGNEQIEVVYHSLIIKEGKEENIGKGVVIGVKNITSINIGKIIFEAKLFDVKGNVVDVVRYNMSDLEEGKSRNVNIETPKANAVNIKSYYVEIIKIITTPIPLVVDNDRIKILKHALHDMDDNIDPFNNTLKTSVDLAIKNVSDKTVSTAIFSCIFYDSEGNVLNKIYHKEYDIKPNACRLISISTIETLAKIKSEYAKSYNVTLIKTITTDTEKIQLLRSEVKEMSSNSKEVIGLLKNISDVIVDTVVAVTFLDNAEEKIGMKILQVKDIKPYSTRQFSLVFTPPEGYIVKTHIIDIGETIKGEITDEWL